MIYILLIIIIVFLLLRMYQKDKKIKNISVQINEILFQQKDLYQQIYQEGSLSLLENEITKLVNKLYENNELLKKDKILFKEYLENISHQLKTPLTSLYLIHERLKESEGKEKKVLLKQQEQLFYKIEWLVAALLKMAQMDAQTVIFQKETISQEDFIKRFIKPFDIQLELKDIHLDISMDSHDIHNIDILWTLEALSNIFKNCIEHIQEEGTIHIHISDNLLYTEFIIEDNGRGIDKEDLPHLFERFYKGKNARDQSIGIGLALSQMIVENQNGTISVENVYPGTKFMIRFYKEVI